MTLAQKREIVRRFMKGEPIYSLRSDPYYFSQHERLVIEQIIRDHIIKLKKQMKKEKR